MDLDITVTSQELVKPSSLNLNHLPCHHLSSLDQLAVPYFMPFVFFYHKNCNLSDKERTDNMFGNIMGYAITVPKTIINKDDEAKPSLVEQMRKEIRKIDTLYVKQLQEDCRAEFQFRKQQMSDIVKGETVPFTFTSLCHYPMYEADFGWGKPLWVASARMNCQNRVAFFDTKEGDGIEAWINLDQQDMSRFETNGELLRYVSSNPSVIVSAT